MNGWFVNILPPLRPTHASRVCFGLPNLLKVGVDRGAGTG